MNPIIASYFDEIEMRLIESPVVASYKQVRREITPTDDKLRIRATLIDGGLFQLFEYVAEEKGAGRFAKVQLSLAGCRWRANLSLGQRQAPHRSAQRASSPSP